MTSDKNSTTQPLLDVSRLPSAALDHRSPIWWGNTLLLLIETTMFALMVGAYYYVRQNFNVWPPPTNNGPWALLRPAPTLSLPLISLIVLTISAGAAILADVAAFRRNAALAKLGMSLLVLFTGALIWMRFREFLYLNCRWDDNAYASIIWTIMGMHLLHFFVAAAEGLIMTIWLFVHGLDDKHARDMHCLAIYWYWIVVIWWILFGVIFYSPRLFPQGQL